MKSAPCPRETPTPDQRLMELLRLQEEALRRVLKRDSECAPCRNRTYNLMIKSQIRAFWLARTGSVQPASHATKLAELVPHGHPDNAPNFHALIPELGPRPELSVPPSRSKQKQKDLGWTEKALPSVASQQQEPGLKHPESCPHCGTHASKCQYEDALGKTRCAYTRRIVE